VYWNNKGMGLWWNAPWKNYDKKYVTQLFKIITTDLPTKLHTVKVQDNDWNIGITIDYKY